MASIISEGEGKGLVNILSLKLGLFQNAVLPKCMIANLEEFSLPKLEQFD